MYSCASLNRTHFYAVIGAAFFLLCAGVVSSAPMCSQFGNLAPLPGGGFAVDPNGNLDGLGALQINIPVAYTPLAGYVVASGAAGGTFGDKSSFKNGTGVLGFSVGGWQRLWLSGMLVSKSSAVANGQLSDR